MKKKRRPGRAVYGPEDISDTLNTTLTEAGALVGQKLFSHCYQERNVLQRTGHTNNDICTFFTVSQNYFICHSLCCLYSLQILGSHADFLSPFFTNSKTSCWFLYLKMRRHDCLEIITSWTLLGELVTSISIFIMTEIITSNITSYLSKENVTQG